MKILKVFIVLVLLTSCSSKQNTIEQYLTYPVKYPKKEIKEPNGNYSIFIPKDWELVSNEHLTDSNVAIYDVYCQNDNLSSRSRIEVLKITNVRNLEAQFKSQMELNELEFSYDKIKVLSSGKSDLLNYSSYYIHKTVSNNIYKGNNYEEITFITGDEENDNYYHITVTTEKNKKQEMSMMLNCLKTFKILN